MKIFEFETYQEVIQSFLKEQKTLGNPFTYQKIAEFLRVQKSYLSKVMAKNASLNKDQGYLLSKLMKLKEDEREYLFLLIDFERAAVDEFKKELKEKIKEIQLKNTQSSSYLNKKRRNINSPAEQVYYLYPEFQLLHLGFSIARFQNSPELLQKELNMSDGLFQQGVRVLQDLNLIKVEETRIELLDSNLHLPNDSEMFHQWQTQFKLKSIEWAKKIEFNDKYNFVASFTASEEDKEKIRLEFMSFLKKTEAIVKDSPSKNLYQINFDLFKWL